LSAVLRLNNEHPKLKASLVEILRDWDAVIAFVYHKELPPTNNEAERALRHAGKSATYQLWDSHKRSFVWLIALY